MTEEERKRRLRRLNGQAFGDDGVLKDGKAIRVPMAMMDAASKEDDPDAAAVRRRAAVAQALGRQFDPGNLSDGQIEAIYLVLVAQGVIRSVTGDSLPSGVRLVADGYVRQLTDGTSVHVTATGRRYYDAAGNFARSLSPMQLLDQEAAETGASLSAAAGALAMRIGDVQGARAVADRERAEAWRKGGPRAA